MADKPKRKPVLKYIFGGLGVLLLLALIFYQPIVLGLVQVIAQQYARSQKLNLSFRIHGSLLTDVFLEDVHLSAQPENKTFAIEKLDAETIGARYRPWNFLKKDYRNVVDLVHLKNVDVVLRPTAPAQPPAKKPAAPLRFPPFIPKQVDIENVNFRLRGNTEDILVQAFAMDFGQDRSGSLSAARLTIPPVGDWTKIRAEISERRGVITLRGLHLPPLAVVDDFGLDLSRLNEGQVGLALGASILDAPIEAQLGFRQGDTGSFLRARLTNLDLAKLGRLISLPLTGNVKDIDAAINGDLERPDSWSGTAQFSATPVTYLDYTVDSVGLSADLLRGAGTVRNLQASAGNNRLSVAGTFRLPPSFDSFLAQTSAHLGLILMLPEPKRFLPAAQGSLAGGGTIGLRQGRAQARIQLSGADLGLPVVQVSQSRVTAFGAARLPLADNPWNSLAMITGAEVHNVQASPIKAPGVNATVTALDGQNAQVLAQIVSGQSKIALDAHSPLPTPKNPFDPKQITGNVQLHVESLGDFTDTDMVEGSLTADGNFAVSQLRPNGFLRASGNQLRYRGFVLPRLAVDATAHDGMAEVRDAKLAIDDFNFARLTGTATLSGQIPYQASGTIHFADLAVLNEILVAFGQPAGLQGTFDAHLKASGTAQNRIPESQFQAAGQTLSYRGVELKSLEVQGMTANGLLQVPTVRLAFDDQNTITARASAALADPYTYEGHAAIDFENLGVFHDLLANLGKPSNLSGKFQATLDAAGDIRNPLPRAQFKAAGQQIKASDLLIQDLAINADTDNNIAFLRNFKITFDPRNTINLTGDFSAVDPFNYHADGSVNFADLRTFNGLLKAIGPDPGLAGRLSASFIGQGNARSKLPSGTLSVVGDHFLYRGLPIEDLDIAGKVENEELNIEAGRVVFDPKNRVDIHILAKLTEPYTYRSNAMADFEDLSFLNPLLASFGQSSGAGGKLTMEWHGEGALRSSTGQLQLQGNQLRLAGFVLPRLIVDATAQNGAAVIRNAKLSFDDLNFAQLTGTASLAGQFPYEGTGVIHFTDLGVLNEILVALRQPTGLKGALDAHVKASGNAQSRIPEAQFQVTGQTVSYRGVPIKSLELQGATANGSLQVPAIRLAFDDQNTVTARASAALADPYAYEGHAAINLENLDVFHNLLANLGKPSDLSGKFQATLDATGDVRNPLPRTQFKAAGQQIKASDLLIQDLSINADADNNIAFLRNFKITFDPSNRINLTGDFSAVDPYNYHAEGSVNFSDLRTFNGLLKAIGPDPGLAGRLSASFIGQGNARSKLPSGTLSVVGDHLLYRGLPIEDLDIAGKVEKEELNIETGRVAFDSKNRLDIHGSAKLTEPYTYQSDATADFEDLSFLNQLLASFGQTSGTAGKLSMQWHGKGELRNSTGTVQLRASQLRLANVAGIDADVEGNYQGLEAQLSKINIRSPYADLDSTLRVTPEQLEIPNLTIRKNQNALSGNLKVPLNFRPGAKIPIALDKPLEIDLRGDRIPLSAFQPGKPEVTGNIDLLIQASGALQDLAAKVHLGINDIRSPAVSTLAAAQASIDAQLSNKNLNLTGDFRQPDIQPAQLRGSIPVDVRQIIETGKMSEDTPLQLSMRWPDTNLAFLRKLSSQVRIIEGRAGVDANVGGTLQRPVVTGSVRSNVSRFQARTDVVPPISNFVVNINFRQDRITFDQFNGLAGGGPFGLRGSIDLTKGTDPLFDLLVTGREILITRSDTVIVRSNLNLAVRGPLSAGEVSGVVGVTNSRFFQDIDILPLNLPGRPAPTPPAVPPPSSVGIKTAPLSNWKFNIDVRTDQQFRVESNLARGKVTINLHAAGTGATPSVTGFVRVDSLIASLPFSHLNITNGYVNFVPGGNPLDPVLNIVGTSQVRDYDVRVRIFGNVSNFQILFDSTPPLAQGDIASLLATGATTAEFVENPSLLAGRATFLLAQQLLTKVFRVRPNPNQQAFLERLQVNIIPGARAGTQDVSARFALTKNWQIIGDVGQQGDVSGRLRYFIRFR